MGYVYPDNAPRGIEWRLFVAPTLANQSGVGAETTRQEAEQMNKEQIEATLKSRLPDSAYLRVYLKRARFEFRVNWDIGGAARSYEGEGYIDQMGNKTYVDKLVGQARGYFGDEVLRVMGWPK